MNWLRVRKSKLLICSLAIAVGLNLAFNFRVPVQAAAAVLPPNNCVGIASDSNGDGHVTMQMPPLPGGDVGIVFIRPYAPILRQELDVLGLDYLTVADHSLTASGLTSSDRTNYLKSNQYGGLIADRCKFNIVGPFIPDVAAAKATPEQYSAQLVPLIGGLISKNPHTTIFVLSHYQTARADFTASNNGFGMTADRINAFIARFIQVCQPSGTIGRIPQVMCLDTQSFFAGMGTSYLLTSVDQAQFKTIIYGPSSFRPRVEQFFADHPDEKVVGDGIHLSLAGRVRLMHSLAALISRMSDF